jgi:hypothetical protein
MPEQKRTFMQDLDLWSDANVVGPLSMNDPQALDWENVVEQVKKAIRAKVLESYRNGQQAGPRSPAAVRQSTGSLPRREMR